MSRLYIGFLAACLAAAASALFAPRATAQQLPTTIEIAQSMDEAAFKQRLVDHSPWSVTWQNHNGREGYHQLRFTMKGSQLSGEYFGSNTGPQVNPLTSLKLKRSENKMCASFNIVGRTGNRDYTYCLQADGTMKGPYEGMSDRGSTYGGFATASPATRK